MKTGIIAVIVSVLMAGSVALGAAPAKHKLSHAKVINISKTHKVSGHKLTHKSHKLTKSHKAVAHKARHHFLTTDQFD